MIVIAIIGILITMLMPSLSQAREKGRTAVCLSNYKQLAMVNFTFSSDNDNRTVGSGSYILKSNGSVEYPSIFNWLYFDRKKVINRLGPTEQGEIGCPSSMGIHKYERSVMYNIDLRGGPWWSSNAPTKYGKVVEDPIEWPGPAYNENAVYKLGGKVMKVLNPSEFMMFADAESSGDVLNPNFYNKGVFTSSISYSESGALVMKSIAFRHGEKTTTAFTDGHAKLTTPVYENFHNSKLYFEAQ